MATPVEERFWPKVQIRAANECWEWQAAKGGHGYGAIAACRERRTLQAHRVSYEMARGRIAEGLHVLHRCDNPPCVNPAHLFLGTHQENMSDMRAKGRLVVPRGVDGRAKLTDEDVREIRAARGTLRDIATKFEVTTTSIWRIKKRILRGHVQ